MRKQLTATEFKTLQEMSYEEKNKGFMTASKLKLFLKCPYSYQQKYELNNPDYQEQPTKSLEIGNAVDFFANYGEVEFYKHYEILEPRKRRSDDSDKIQFTNSDGKVLPKIFAELKRQPLFRYNDPKATRQLELIGNYQTSYGEIKIKGTPDTIFLDEKHIDDTKTVGVKGNMAFDKACRYNILDYDYIFSMAFYNVLYYLEFGEFAEKLTLSFVGTNETPKFLQYEILREDWEKAVEKIKAGLEMYAKCKHENYFPTYAEIHKDDLFRHLSSPFYNKNPGAIQENPIYFITD